MYILKRKREKKYPLLFFYFCLFVYFERWMSPAAHNILKVVLMIAVSGPQCPETGGGGGAKEREGREREAKNK